MLVIDMRQRTTLFGTPSRHAIVVPARQQCGVFSPCAVATTLNVLPRTFRYHLTAPLHRCPVVRRGKARVAGAPCPLPLFTAYRAHARTPLVGWQA